MDPDPLGEDRGWEPCGEREQRGVSAFAAAIDPVALETLLQPVGGDVLPSVPAGDQPPVDASPLKLLVSQCLCDLSEWSGSGISPRPSRSVISPPGVVWISVVLSGRNPSGRFAIEQQNAPRETVARIELWVVQQPPEDRKALLIIDRRASREPIVPIDIECGRHVRSPQPREEEPDTATLPAAVGDPLIHQVLAKIG